MNATEPSEPKPPVFKTWGGWYRLLLAFTMLQFMLYFWLTLNLNQL